MGYGATAVSAAGSLVEAGAAEVLVLPIARIIDGGFGRVIPAFSRPRSQA